MADSIYDFGIDIDSSWSFQDGDLKIISNKDNLIQSIVNKLNTMQDSLNLFYNDYGSILFSFLGWRRNNTTLGFIKLEVDRVVGSDSRINNFESIIDYDENNAVRIDLRIWHDESSVFDLNLVLDEDGVSEVNTDGS